MVSHLFFYQLALIALVWLFFMFLYTWPSDRARRPSLAAPIAPRRKRSNEPKAFEGLTHKPHCALCERDTAQPHPPSPVPPAPMPPTNRRPREVDTSRHFCPHSDCDYRGWLGRGNLRANGHPSGGPWRQFSCTSCQGYFLETNGTLFHGKQAAVELIVRVLVCLAEGLGIRATARVFEVDPNTVLHWLVEAAEQLRAFASYFLCDLHVEQLQLDEVYAVLRDLEAGAISDDEALRRLEHSPYWVWTAMEPTSKLLVVVEVGSRTWRWHSASCNKQPSKQFENYRGLKEDHSLVEESFKTFYESIKSSSIFYLGANPAKTVSTLLRLLIGRI